MNIKIPDGSYCCLLGPSGCGKTTILRMIAGHEDPTAGEILIGGENVVGLPPVARRTAMMFQSYALFPHLSVRDNIAFALRVRGVSKAARRKGADAMMERVRLTEFADRLSETIQNNVPLHIGMRNATWSFRGRIDDVGIELPVGAGCLAQARVGPPEHLAVARLFRDRAVVPVSYTHLTLPTKRIV